MTGRTAALETSGGGRLWAESEYVPIEREGLLCQFLRPKPVSRLPAPFQSYVELLTDQSNLIVPTSII